MTQLIATWERPARPRAARPRPARRKGMLLAPLAVLLLACGGVALAVQTAGPEPRTVTLHARGMAFYLPGDPTPNPRLVVAAGEELRLVLRNEDRGIPHDLAVPKEDGDWRSTRLLRAPGETAELGFRAPETAGEYAYLCTAHSRMMRGVLEVR